eukprot:15435208-Alexandrium_andersonii.AAC.1
MPGYRHLETRLHRALRGTTGHPKPRNRWNWFWKTLRRARCPRYCQNARRDISAHPLHLKNVRGPREETATAQDTCPLEAKKAHAKH